MTPPNQVPSSTYRLQITADFTLDDAATVTGYLAKLGVGAVYVSPLLHAVSGSAHGYDVVDHRGVDPARGGDHGLNALATACRVAGLAMVVDIVPNHMGVAAPEQNPMWWEVLRLGRKSAYAGWFDIDWTVNDGRVLLPVLGDSADPDGDLKIHEGELRYYEHRFPIAPGTGDGSPAEVHDRQHYELVNFRRGDAELNYRRFFAVTGLAGLRVEDPAVFESSHAEVLRWTREYGVTGLRIDHPDGLVDPQGYLARLAAATPDAWVTVEKITEPGEQLPGSWPVAGMTGYDGLSEVNNVLVDPGAKAAMTSLYVSVTGDERNFEQHVADGKRLVATTILQAEVRRLARLVDVDDAVAALTELAVAFPVYRSYLPLGREHLDEAVARVARHRPDLDATVRALLPRLTDPGDELCMRFQQLTGAVMAKGVEDTAYYRYTRLIGLNEVGGYPGAFGCDVDAFHAAQRHRAVTAPKGMTTLSTHDTKRGEDIRARLAVLAEIPQHWGAAVRRLMELAAVPNRAFGYLLWQTAVALPALNEQSPDDAADAVRPRLHAYAEKAMREAADGTGWIDPDRHFEAAVHAAVDTAFDDCEAQLVIASIAARIEGPARVNSLTQKLIQLTMPGVPDVYQGSELWEDSLVDLDNRRPIDYAQRNALLDSLSSAPRLDHTAAAKLWVVTRALRARRDRPELFTGYTPVPADGPAADHVIAFDRGGAITVATRLPVGLAAAGGWRNAAITVPAGRYTDALTGRTWGVLGYESAVGMGELLTQYPVALLTRETG